MHSLAVISNDSKFTKICSGTTELDPAFHANVILSPANILKITTGNPQSKQALLQSVPLASL